MSLPDEVTVKDNSKKYYITAIVLLVIVIILFLTGVFSKNTNSVANQNPTQSNTEEKQKQNPSDQNKGAIQSPDAQDYPWNAGMRVPDNLLANFLPEGNIPQNTVGGFGVMYENEKHNSVLVFLFNDSLEAVQRTCEGGNVRNTPFTPEIKGSWATSTGNTWMPAKMNSEDIGGRKCWVTRGIDVVNYSYHQMGLVIFIGYSLTGGPKENPKAGWDKWLFDQRERARMVVIPGTYTNGGGGANVWYFVKK